MLQSEEIRVWGMHTQDDRLFLKDNKIAIGWRDFGDLSKALKMVYIPVPREEEAQ